MIFRGESEQKNLHSNYFSSKFSFVSLDLIAPHKGDEEQAEANHAWKKILIKCQQWVFQKGSPIHVTNILNILQVYKTKNGVILSY